jgi:CDP-diacylglycerol--glycerol-3-phosphate 3-phosphatidyltransferase
VAGAPAWLAVAAGGVSWLHEYVRARAASAGMKEIGVVTVGERPTRVAVTVSGLVVGGVAALVHDSWGAMVVTAAAAAWLALALIGVVQLAASVRRALSA